MNLLCAAPACSRALLPGTRLRALHPTARLALHPARSPHARTEDCPAHAAHHPAGASPKPARRKPPVATPSCTCDHAIRARCRAYAPPSGCALFSSPPLSNPCQFPDSRSHADDAESASRPARSDLAMYYTLPTTPLTHDDDDRIDARAPDALCAFADTLPTAWLPSPLPPMTRYALATRALLRQYVALSYPHDPLLCARTPRV
ncbi:hypothetical protein C8J57DRAFT_1577248 [Mycena rebaudengoi]|nr:hypothetical protein C8J57DRAFT_1577248 [Mycena rebaudengoi]